MTSKLYARTFLRAAAPLFSSQPLDERRALLSKLTGSTSRILEKRKAARLRAQDVFKGADENAEYIKKIIGWGSSIMFYDAAPQDTVVRATQKRLRNAAATLRSIKENNKVIILSEIFLEKAKGYTDKNELLNIADQHILPEAVSKLIKDCIDPDYADIHNIWNHNPNLQELQRLAF